MRSVSEFNQPVQKLFTIKNNKLKGFLIEVIKGNTMHILGKNFPKHMYQMDMLIFLNQIFF